MIAPTFGCTSGRIESSPCFGKWRGTSDLSLRFDNGASLRLGNYVTSQARTAKVRNESINRAFTRYNPEIVAATKEAALVALLKREAEDNAIAAQKGLKPYTMLNVEICTGEDSMGIGCTGWYYVTLAVEGKIHAHFETGLSYRIAKGSVSEIPSQESYFIACGLKESNVDYVFDNVGFSSNSNLYALPIVDTVLKRAERTLAERSAQPHKPSIKAQLAVKPVPGDNPITKPKDREVR